MVTTMKFFVFIRNVVIPFVLMSLFTGGCVSKPRFEEQVEVSKALSMQLQEEKERRGELEKEVLALKDQFEKLKSGFITAKASTLDLMGKSDERLLLLENARQLTIKVGSQIKNIFKDKFDGVKKEYEDVLKQAEEKISHFKDSLNEKEIDFPRLRRKVKEKIEELKTFLEKLKETEE